jgi:hypothetical protein
MFKSWQNVKLFYWVSSSHKIVTVQKMRIFNNITMRMPILVLLWFIRSRLNTTITALPVTEFGFVRDINEPLSTCKYYMNNNTAGLYGHYFKIFFEQKRHV